MLDRKTAGSMKNYEEYQDEELIRRLRDGDGSVMDYLMEKYKDLVRRKARSMYPSGRGSGGSDPGGDDRAVQGGAGL